MKESALKLATMMQDLPLEKRQNILVALDKCPVLKLEDLSENEKRTKVISEEHKQRFIVPKIKLVLEIRQALMKHNPTLLAQNSDPYIDVLIPIIEPGVSYYLYANSKERQELQKMFLGQDSLKKSNEIKGNQQVLDRSVISQKGTEKVIIDKSQKQR